MKTKSVHDSIPRVQSKIFLTNKKKTIKTATYTLKSDVQLFSRLFIVSTARELDLNEFVQYENQQSPPSLSVNGSLRPGSKSVLIPLLEALAPATDLIPSCDGCVFDDAGLVHFLKPRIEFKSFSQYYLQQFKPYIEKVAATTKATRLDVAWDLYYENSLKNAIRENRGTGLRQNNLPKKSE